MDVRDKDSAVAKIGYETNYSQESPPQLKIHLPVCGGGGDHRDYFPTTADGGEPVRAWRLAEIATKQSVSFYALAFYGRSPYLFHSLPLARPANTQQKQVFCLFEMSYFMYHSITGGM